MSTKEITHVSLFYVIGNFSEIAYNIKTYGGCTRMQAGIISLAESIRHNKVSSPSGLRGGGVDVSKTLCSLLGKCNILVIKILKHNLYVKEIFQSN